LGTDEARIFRVLDAMRGNNAEIEALDRNYRAKYGDLIADLRGDLSGDDYEHVRAILAPVLQDVSFEDCNAPGNISDVRTAVRDAIQAVEHAIQALSTGLSGMSATDLAAFNKHFNPSASGGIDDAFVRDVLFNFRKILAELNHDYSIQCETSADSQCAVPNRYGYVPDLTFRTFGFHTDVHLCPHFFTMDQPNQVRGIIHETTHNALIVLDRPYRQDPEYANLTPRGSWARNIPFVGIAVTAIARSDTLNAPDAYACFACDVSGLTVGNCT
jgi:hypothetical protein